MVFSKKGALTANKTVIIVLAILTVLAFIGLIITLDPNFTFKLFPDFNTAPDDLDEELSYTGQANPCTTSGLEAVAKLVGEEDEKGTKLGRIQLLSKNNNEIVYKKDSQWSLWLDEEKVAVRVNEKVVVDPKYLDENNLLFVKDLFVKNPHGVTAKDLAILQDAEWKNSGWICKEDSSEVSEGYVGVWPQKELHLDPKQKIVTVTLEKSLLEKITSFATFWTKKDNGDSRSFYSYDFSPYFYCPEIENEFSFSFDCNEEKDFISLSDKEGYPDFYIYKKETDKELGPVFRLAKDGSLWIDENLINFISNEDQELYSFSSNDEQNYPGRELSGEVKIGREGYNGFLRTNLYLTSGEVAVKS